MSENVYPKASEGGETAHVAPNPSFPDMEETVLDYWDKDDTFQQSVERNPSGDHSQNEFVFFDGPPFANGLPHYGHLLTGYAKDVIPRYQTMKGRKVNRVFGWDTHGLPAELEAQKELGIDSVDQIEKMGIDKFNDACRASVLKYTNEWQNYVHRQARWVDFEHGYKTLNIPYMESVMWAFKQLYDKGLAYQGYRVLPYCPKDRTPLSAHELRMDADVYQDRQDTTVSVAVKMRDEDGNINMHRPWIDNLVRVNPDDPTGKSHMHRISDVLDCWFESGSMSFAQFHYPFENKEKFEQHFPADYIVEYIGQTRGWFYLLHVMATALFDRPAFKNVICHGIVLGSDGQKMSKHLRNYPDVNGVFDKYGSDAMRWFLMSSPILRGGNLIVTAEGIRDTVRQVMLPVWSSYYFFTLYANG